MSDGLGPRAWEWRHRDWSTGNGESAWEPRAQEKVQVLSHTRRRTKGKAKRASDLELELAELKRAFSMLSEFVRQREIQQLEAKPVSSPLDTYLASLGEDSDKDIPRVELTPEMIASILADE